MALKKIKYAILCGYQIKEPTRGTPYSAGMDIYCPEMTPKFVEDFFSLNSPAASFLYHKEASPYIFIPAGGACWIPTGLKINIPQKSYIDVATKSGTFKKKRLKVGSHVIDSDYQGQIIISLFNTSPFVGVIIYPGEPIAQLLHKPILISPWEKVNINTLYPKKTLRGEGGFGSTGA